MHPALNQGAIHGAPTNRMEFHIRMLPKFAVHCTNNVSEKVETLFHHGHAKYRKLLYLKGNNLHLFTLRLMAWKLH
jgi:hypothetical protein